MHRTNTARPVPTIPMTAFSGLVLTALIALPVAPAAAQSTIDPRIQALLADVSPQNLETILLQLESFGTRHTMSLDLGDDRGIGAARAWILEQFQSYSPRLQASFDCYDVLPQGRIPGEVELCNVMAVLPGRTERRIYVSGHYDTVARRADTGGFDWDRWENPAPGVNDDGSGTALTMELARAFAQSNLQFDATIVFIALAAEEEGLVGANLHAARMAEEGVTIDAVFNNDIIGNSIGGNGIVDTRTVRVFSEGPEDSPSRQLARFIRRQAAAYVPGHEVRLIAREDRFGRGGDHTAFNQWGFAGVRFSESRENYSRQHTPEDTYENNGVDVEYLAKNARVNAAGVATMALAPAAPEVLRGGSNPMLGRGESGYDAEMTWRPADGAAGYRIFWRRTWGPDWEQEVYVGNVTEYTLRDISIDDYTFGVASVDAFGHESLVSVYVRPPRARSEIQTRGGGGQ